MAKSLLLKAFTAKVVSFTVEECPVTETNPTGKYIKIVYCDNTIDPFESTDRDNKTKVLFVSAKAIAMAEQLLADGKPMPDRKLEKFYVTELPGFVSLYKEDGVKADGTAYKAGEPATYPNGDLRVKNEMIIDILVGGSSRENPIDIAMRIISDPTRFELVDGTHGADESVVEEADEATPTTTAK